MKCPKCGAEVDDIVSFCPFCGADLHASTVQSNNIVSNDNSSAISAKQEPTQGLTPENFRDVPTYGPNLRKMNIFGAISMLGSGLCLFGSLMIRLFESKAAIPVGVSLLSFGLLIGLVFLILLLSLNKKTFPQVNGIKMKGFKEVFPAIATALTLCMIIGALVVQGIFIIVY